MIDTLAVRAVTGALETKVPLPEISRDGAEAEDGVVLIIVVVAVVALFCFGLSSDVPLIHPIVSDSHINGILVFFLDSSERGGGSSIALGGCIGVWNLQGYH
eukprot:CAMPEP_0116155150 /NCGR_PEP_ID=MMETSP0329-20121206/22156_2 /TAXON_ID=697910 /ORGANISM="Pseudo-nitzschia arenysensis, Strain B593" /LENGTH=101 /DNA_ID=CAMNT_0003652169 /DNA_START=650 /DNA_END=955 /DNA_ORIENTATION=-